MDVRACVPARRRLGAWFFIVTLVAVVTLAAPPGAAAADKALTRTQAVKALTQTEPALRRTGVERLGEVGTMADADRLVARLSDDDAQVRELAAASLWMVWSRSNDRAIDALFQRGVTQMSESQLAEAEATFSEIIRRKPAFAEGWNKRATVRFLRGDYEASLKDCAEVMKRNPNHFGALSGYGQIYVTLGDFERAIGYFERALEVNPNLASAALTIEILKQQVEERRRHST